MNEKIERLVRQINELEDELKATLLEQQAEIRYRVEGTRIEFEKKIKQTHRQLRVGLFRWLRSSKPRNVLSAPFIYGMILPMTFMDLTLTLYQWICFRLYRIPRVQRSDYIVIDRHQLAYLNLIEKLNCSYCAYANGLLAYAREITSRTEQYWCPIKHARKMQDPHRRYLYFLPYGEAEDYHLKQRQYRRALRRGDIPLYNVLEAEGLNSDQLDR